MVFPCLMGVLNTIFRIQQLSLAFQIFQILTLGDRSMIQYSSTEIPVNVSGVPLDCPDLELRSETLEVVPQGREHSLGPGA